MSHFSVFFSTPTWHTFTWLDNYDRLSDREIKELLVECQMAKDMLRAELSRRQDPSHQSAQAAKKSKELELIQKAIRDKAKRTREGEDEADRPENQAETFGSDQTAQDENPSLLVLRNGLHKEPKTREKWFKAAYNELLWLVSKVVSPSHSLLLSCVGRTRLERLDSDMKVRLIQFLSKERDSLFCSHYQDKAIRLELLYTGMTVSQTPVAWIEENNFKTDSRPEVVGKRNREEMEQTWHYSNGGGHQSKRYITSTFLDDPIVRVQDPSQTPCMSLPLEPHVGCHVLTRPPNDCSSSGRPTSISVTTFPNADGSEGRGVVSNTAQTNDLQVNHSSSIQAHDTREMNNVTSQRVGDGEDSSPSRTRSPSQPTQHLAHNYAGTFPSLKNFLGFKQLLPQAARLLLLLCTLNTDSIPEILFCRLRSPRRCWDCNGEIEEVPIFVADSLVAFIQSTQFNDNIQRLESSNLIGSEPGALGKRKFSIEPSSREFIKKTAPTREESEWICLVLVCHAFPGTSEEISFADTGRALLPLLKHTVEQCYQIRERIIQEPSTGYGILLALLLSSRLSSQDWKLYAIDLAEKILSDKPQFGGSKTFYLQKLAEQRSRDISRRLPDITIRALCEYPTPIDPRTNALYGEYLRSNAQDLIMDHNHTDALEQLGRFDCFRDSPSTMEEWETARHRFVEGKIYRWDASFVQATDVFYGMLTSRFSQLDETGYNLIGHLVGALCEQRRLVEAEKHAREEVKAFTDLDQYGIKRKDLGVFRNLRLSLAEVLVCQALVETIDRGGNMKQKLEETEHMYEQLEREHKSLRSRGQRSWSSEFNYLRVCFGRALIPHLAGRFIEARDRWNQAQTHAEMLIRNEKVTRFTPMVIDYCLCDINNKLGNLSEARLLLERARKCFEEVGREYWWTGIGSFLLDLLRASIPDSGIQ